MGGRGAMLKSGGFSVPNQWETVDYIEGYKVIEPKDKSKKPNLPYVSYKPEDTYILMKNGKFSQLRKYGTDRLPVYDIDFGNHRGREYLHMHFFKDGIRLSGDTVIPLKEGDYYYEKYKRVFIGVSL